MPSEEMPEDELDNLSLRTPASSDPSLTSSAPDNAEQHSAISSPGASNVEPGRRRRLSSTAAVAALVTVIVMAPLWAISVNAAAAVSGDGIEVDVGDGPIEFAGSTVVAGSTPAIAVHVDDAVALSWSIAAPDAGEANDDGVEVNGPDFLLDRAAVTIATLDPGLYDLLIVATLRTGSTVQRAARFQVVDAQ